MAVIGTEFEVWVCPECKDCYAAPSSQGVDLTIQMNRDIKSKVTFSRGRCQRCSTPNKEVMRVRYIAKVDRLWELPRPNISETDYYRFMDEQAKKGEQHRAGPSD